SDQEQKSRTAPQKVERGLNAANHDVLKGLHLRMKARIDQKLLVYRKTIQVCRVERVHLLLRLFDRRSGFQSPDIEPTVGVPGIIGLLLRCECQRYPIARVGIPKFETSRHYAHDGEWAAAHANLLADSAWLAAIKLLPESVTENDL